jgi:DNA ligase-1
MLSEDIEKVQGDLSFPKLVSTKLDGIRCVTRYGDALTRSLKCIPNSHIRERLAPYPGLDGEIISGLPNDPKVYSNTYSAVMTEVGAPQFVFYVFDLTDCHQGISFSERYKMLQQRQFPSWIQVLPQVEVTSREQLMAEYARHLEDGYEGAIIRNPNSTYKYGRATAKSQDMLKVKPFADREAVITGLFEAMHNANEAFTDELGRTVRSSHKENLEGLGMLGGFHARDTETGVEFDCAPGVLTHAERKQIWDAQAAVGKTLVYRSLLIGVKDKPRHPRFKGWRDKIDL